MNQGLKYTFMAHVVVAGVFGLLMFLVPAAFAALIQWPNIDPLIARSLGAAELALAVSSWLAFRAVRWDEVRIVVQMEIAFTVLGALGTLYELLFGGAPAIGWIVAVVFAVFAVLWVYFYATVPSRAMRRAA